MTIHRMFSTTTAAFAGAVALALYLATSSCAQAAPPWTEGKNYFLISPARPPAVGPGKVEVTEIFSYACPACNQFLPVMNQLKQALPPNVVVDYVPASFNPAEDWPMFQLAFCTAQSLGVAARTHDALFAAVWSTGELAVLDPATHAIKAHLPTIADAAAFYQRHAGVPVQTFLSTAKSFAVDREVRAAEETVQAYQVDRTPTLVVNGKYRLYPQSVGGYDELLELVKWLVAKESR